MDDTVEAHSIGANGLVLDGNVVILTTVLFNAESRARCRMVDEIGF